MEPVAIQIEPGEPPCAICLDTSGYTRWLRLECSHAYHKKCINRWFETEPTCPVCLRRVNPGIKFAVNAQVRGCCGLSIFLVALILLLKAYYS
jgi:Ring finger domain